MNSVELRDGGAEEKVTDANKDEYIDLIIKWRFVSRVEEQMKALMKGVHELIPPNLLSIFDPNELELLICGLQKIDVKDWKDNTLYKGGYSPSHPVISSQFLELYFLRMNVSRKKSELRHIMIRTTVVASENIHIFIISSSIFLNRYFASKSTDEISGNSKLLEVLACI